MSLSAGALGNLIFSNMQAFGANGSNLHKFTTAVGTGIVTSIVGKSFVTADAGLVEGFGAGSGTGLTGPQPSAMESIALSLMPTKGKNAEKLMNAIMAATVTHLGSASLVSTDAPVFLGAGTIIPGSITVVESEMANNIDSQLLASGAKGKNRTILANAIAAGVARQILSAGTGTLTIAGSPLPGKTPTPGSGSGSGTIS